MSDKILLFLLVFCLGYGGYLLISKSTQEPADEALKPASAPATATTPATAEKPAEKSPAAKKVLPPKISTQELTQLFRVDGIAKGTDKQMVIINNTLLHEGETLDDLRIDKIMASHAEVSYKGHTYQLAQQLLPNAIN